MAPEFLTVEEGLADFFIVGDEAMNFSIDALSLSNARCSSDATTSYRLSG